MSRLLTFLAQNNNGETAMHWAALMDQPQIQLELWHYGADETLADNDGDTALVIFT